MKNIGAAAAVSSCAVPVADKERGQVLPAGYHVEHVADV